MQVSALTAIFKADFGRFRPVPAVFRPISAVSAAGRYDPIWPIRPDCGRISPIRRESKPIRHESSRIDANRAESARIREKKKKIADAVRRAGNRVERRVPLRVASDAGAAPLVPRSCFLAFHNESLNSKVRQTCNPFPTNTFSFMLFQKRRKQHSRR